MSAPTKSIDVLHMDDDAAFADIAGTYVEREDDRFEIQIVQSGTEALNALSNAAYDCIVSDYEMPGLDGLELLERVREHSPELPFILFTGKGSEEIASEAITAGVTDYIQKGRGTETYKLLANRILDAVEHRHARTSYREIFEKIPDGIVIHDPSDGAFTDMNERYAAMFGYERDELLDAGFQAIHPEEQPHTLENARQRVREAANHGPQTFEWPGVTKDGDRFWAEVHLTPTTLHGSDRILAVVRDISDRRDRQERLQAALERIEFALEATDSVIYDVDLETGSETNHGPYDRLFGADASELDTSAEVLSTIIHPDDRDRVASLQEPDALEERGGQIDCDFRAHPDRGEATWIHSEAFVTDGGAEDSSRLVGLATDVTDRKRQERKREQIIDRVTDAIAEVDPEWTITLANEQAAELVGVDEAALLGESFWEVFDVARDSRLEEALRSVMQTRESHSGVEYSSEFDRWFDIEAYPEPEGGIAVYIRDVTGRVERTQDIERMHDLLEHTEQIADVGGWEIDTENEEVFWTEHLFEMLGLDDDQEPPLAEALDVYLGDDRPRVASAVEAALADGESFDVEARFERPDGEVRWFQIQGEPTVQDGAVVSLRGAVQDITARKQREQSLEQTEARFEALAENFPNGGVHYFDHDLRYEYVAGAGFDAVETSPADLEGNTIDEVERYSEDIATTLEALMESTLAGEDAAIEVTYENRIFELRSAPIRDGDDTVTGGFFITQDVTDQRQREQDLEMQNERLDRLASVVSHDLRNPIIVAEGAVELASDESTSKHLETATEALARSQQLIDDLLQLAREGAQVAELEPVDLGPLATACWDNVATEGAMLDVRTQRTIHADRSRLKQLLENLYRNAVEHAGADVSVTVGDLSDGFYIEDDGPGIPTERRSEVLEAGYSTAEGSTGFGLAIVNEIVEGHGWSLAITDSDAGGARFEVTGVEIGTPNRQ